MAHFYGWTDSYIRGLPLETLSMYYEAITIIDAENRLVDINVTSYPNMDNKAKNDVRNDLQKKAKPKHLEKPLTMDQLLGKLNG